MHEFGIAAEIVREVVEVAGRNRLRRVTEVEVSCGAARQVVPDALVQAFEALAADTPAAGALLRVTEEPLRLRCRPCDHEFGATIEDYRCPQCRGADVRLVGGNDIILASVSGERDGGGTA